jgi:hypothetical protein
MLIAMSAWISADTNESTTLRRQIASPVDPTDTFGLASGDFRPGEAPRAAAPGRQRCKAPARPCHVLAIRFDIVKPIVKDLALI